VGSSRNQLPGDAQHAGAGPIRGAAAPVHPVIWLQRRAGNAAVAELLARSKLPTPNLQRARVDLPSGGGVGDAPATNHREGVLLVLDRMHVLWGIDNTEYSSIYPAVGTLGPGDAVTDPAHLALLQRALNRTLEPVLPSQVAAAQYGLSLGSGVGAGQPNVPADVLQVQDLLHSRWHLTDEAYTRERAAVTSGGPTPETIAGISRLKAATLAGTGKTGWAPLIRSDEAGPAGPDGNDRLADRTFTYEEFMVFVPAGATSNLVNRVHVFFSAGGVTGGASHVEHHGLRGAADAGSQILIGVRGEKNRAFTTGGGGDVGADGGEVGQSLQGAPAAPGGALLNLDRSGVSSAWLLVLFRRLIWGKRS
jgi:hypothetical protein